MIFIHFVVDNKRRDKDVKFKSFAGVTLFLKLKMDSLLQVYHQSEHIEAGCDEAGRGCLAGPVFAAAVILPPHFFHPLLNDSKQVKEEDRTTLRYFIERHAVAYAVASVDHAEIDRINILKASFKAMHLALDRLHLRPGFLIIDGNRFTAYNSTPHACIIQGDGIYASIAAASILAKTYRDDYMKDLHHRFPRYNWARNKGYATREHQVALNAFGPCKYHRNSFRLSYSEEDLLVEALT